MCKNIVEAEGAQITLWHMRIAYWIQKAINTHSEYVNLITFPLQLWLHERASVLRCTLPAGYTRFLLKSCGGV
jgi:hypothetical protein